MAEFTLPGGNLGDSDFAVGSELDTKLQAIETVLDGAIVNGHISPSAAIDARKIGDGGAVTQNEVTTTGEANKIPKFDGSGNLVVNKIIFKDGT